MQAGALKGLKVVEMGQLIAGPFAGKTLAEFGADVIKIEAPGAGDPLRNWRLLQAPESVRDYIIYHELMHLREMNHSARFWALVARTRPDMERSKSA